LDPVRPHATAVVHCSVQSYVVVLSAIQSCMVQSWPDAVVQSFAVLCGRGVFPIRQNTTRRN